LEDTGTLDLNEPIARPEPRSTSSGNSDNKYDNLFG